VTRMTRRLMAGAIVALIPVLAGCEAGLNAPTSNFHPAANGAYHTQGDVTINNAFVLGGPLNQSLPAGSDAGLFLAIYSTGGDQLQSVSAPGYAASVKLVDGPVNIPASTSVNLFSPSPEIVLTDLSKALPAGGTIDLTLTFAKAGQIPIDVPVQPQAFSYATYDQPASPAPSPTPTASASGPATITSSPSSSATP
jgi:copper(I)-binding protein